MSRVSFTRALIVATAHAVDLVDFSVALPRESLARESCLRRGLQRVDMAETSVARRDAGMIQFEDEDKNVFLHI